MKSVLYHSTDVYDCNLAFIVMRLEYLDVSFVLDEFMWSPTSIREP